MTERPNTVAGLQAKRAELAKVQAMLEADLRKVTCDLDHLDAAIRLFDAESTPEAIKRYAIKHRAKSGHVTRFVLERLRLASGPVTTRELTLAWLAERGLRTDDATFMVIRRRFNACLVRLTSRGVARSVHIGWPYRGYELAQARD